MGAEAVKEFREVQLDIDTDASTTAAFFTDLPGNVMTSRHTFAFTTEATTTGRRTVNFRLPGTAKGYLCKLRLTSTAAVRVFSAKVLMRYLGGPGGWSWVDLPVEQTALVFTAAPLPIPPTADLFSEAPLPIPPTADLFSELAFLAKAPGEKVWVDIPVDDVA